MSSTKLEDSAVQSVRRTNCWRNSTPRRLRERSASPANPSPQFCVTSVRSTPLHATSESEIRSFLPEPSSRRTRSGPRLRRRQRSRMGNLLHAFPRETLSRPPCASRAKIRPPANSPTRSTPISTAPTFATASASPNSPPTPGADPSKAGCAPSCPRNTSIAIAAPSDS